MKFPMPAGQVILTALYLVAFAALAYYLRARPRRIAGALAGAAVGACLALLALLLGEKHDWWRVPKPAWSGRGSSAPRAIMRSPPRFPAWIVFSPGVVPLLAAAAAYVLLLAASYGGMRVVAGSAQADELQGGS